MTKESTKPLAEDESTKRLIGGGLVAKEFRDQVDVFDGDHQDAEDGRDEGIKRCEAFARGSGRRTSCAGPTRICRLLLNINVMMQPARWLFERHRRAAPAGSEQGRQIQRRLRAARKPSSADCIQQQGRKCPLAGAQGWEAGATTTRKAPGHRRGDAGYAEAMHPQQRMMLANRAMNSPMWRARESRRNLRDDRDLAKAASTTQSATSQRVQAQMMVDICHDEKIIWLTRGRPRVRKKFKRLIALARRQIQLQGDHEGGAVKFLEDIKETCELPPTAGGPLPTRVFERALDGLHVKKQKELREAKRAERRPSTSAD